MEIPNRRPGLLRPSRLEQAWAWVFNIAILALVVLFALNLDHLAIRVRLAPDGSIFSSLLWVGLAFVGALLASAAVHELGHLVAGWLARLRFEQVAIGPLALSRVADHLSLGVHRGGALFGGSVICTPRGSESLPVLRRRLLLFALGGPVASFILALGAAAVWVLALGREWPLWVSEMSLLLAVTSFLFGLGSLKPGFYSSGLPADGQRIVTLTGDDVGAARWCALVTLHSLSQAGVRPRDWPEPMVAQALADNNGSLDDLTTDLMGYYWALDTGQVARAGELLDQAWASPMAWSGVGRAQLALELAFYTAFHQGEPDRGREWLERVPRRPNGHALSHRALAAVLWSEGASAAAAQEARLALAALPRRQADGIAQLEAAWLGQIIGEPENLPLASATDASQRKNNA